MTAPITTQCPNCDARLKLKIANAIGKRIRCPKCAKPFVVEDDITEPDFEVESVDDRNSFSDDFEDDYGSYDDDFEDDGFADRRRKPVKRPSSRRSPAPHRSVGRKRPSRKKSKNTVPILIGAGVGAVLIVAVLVVILVVGRSNRDGGPNIAGNAANGRSATDVAGQSPSSPITDEECREYAARITAALKNRQSTQFASLIDWDSIVDKAAAGVDVGAAASRGFRQGVMSSIDKRGGFCDELIQGVSKDGAYNLVHIGTEGNQRFVLFRLAMANFGGVNYHKFYLQRDAGGRIRGSDLYIYMTGEKFSQTLRRAYLQMAAQQSRSLLDRLAGRDADFVKAMPKI